jgi:1-deoxy-D-xylulose-5-phosphate synthase
MREGSGLVEFSKRFPLRYFDVAIAEQHAVTMAAGMACDGLKPVVAIYSTFLQRAYDQLIHDVALQKLPVVFAIDRAGLVGGDGATHQGSFDLSYQRCIPNLIIMAPADENECRQMLHTALCCGQPAAVRYPRGTGPGASIESELSVYPIGMAELRRSGRRSAILAFGSMVPACQALAQQHDMTLVNMRFIKPLDEEAVLAIAASHDALVTVEENVLAGGAGSAVNEVLLAAGIQMPILNCGIPDRFIEHGSREDCLRAAGLDSNSLERKIATWCRFQYRQHPPACGRGRSAPGDVLNHRSTTKFLRTMGSIALQPRLGPYRGIERLVRNFLPHILSTGRAPCAPG